MAGPKREIVVVVGILAVIALVGLLLPVLARAREQTRRAECSNNLANIALCCRLFAEANGGQYPQRLSQLYPGYVRDLRVFNCPSAKGPKVLVPEDIDTKGGYEYVWKGSVPSGHDVIARERPGNHEGGGSFAIGAGSVEWIDNDLRGGLKTDAETGDPRP